LVDGHSNAEDGDHEERVNGEFLRAHDVIRLALRAALRSDVDDLGLDRLVFLVFFFVLDHASIVRFARMSRRFDRLIDALSTTIVSDRACNQYSRIEGDLRENAIRRRNLRRYLSELEPMQPRMLLIGEAPSYRGGRLTGIPFVSETVMLDGVDSLILGADRGYRKATPGPKLSTEASATMVWETIRSIRPLPVLWNAFPFHPFHAGDPNSNRVPTSGELEIGAEFIERMLRLFPIELVIAIGNQASNSLTRLGIEHDRVRHPSQGGKRLFVEGMKMSTKKAQIQQIKEGLAMRQKTYGGRLQPFGPKSSLPTKNAVDLSTVPSSSKEKYNGGKE